MLEQDQFRLISQRTGGLVERYGTRARLLNLSDRMEVAMGRIPSDPVPWGDADDLEKRLAVPPLPSELWLASSGPSQAMERKLKPCLLYTSPSPRDRSLSRMPSSA